LSFSVYRISDLVVEDGTPLACQIRYRTATTHAERADALRDLVDYCCGELEQYRHLKQKDSEDALTVQIVSILKGQGVDAEHDPQHGGHCDILVKAAHGFIWIAEAKLHSSYTWLDDGFKQLTTRYSTGVPGQDQGEVLIYCKAANSKEKLDKWREELVSRNTEVVVFDDPRGNPLVFHSTHKHENSGLDYGVRHKIVSLYFDPKK